MYLFVNMIVSKAGGPLCQQDASEEKPLADSPPVSSTRARSSADGMVPAPTTEAGSHVAVSQHIPAPTTDAGSEAADLAVSQHIPADSKDTSEETIIGWEVHSDDDCEHIFVCGVVSTIYHLAGTHAPDAKDLDITTSGRILTKKHFRARMLRIVPWTRNIVHKKKYVASNNDTVPIEVNLPQCPANNFVLVCPDDIRTNAFWLLRAHAESEMEEQGDTQKPNLHERYVDVTSKQGIACRDPASLGIKEPCGLKIRMPILTNEEPIPPGTLLVLAASRTSSAVKPKKRARR